MKLTCVENLVDVFAGKGLLLWPRPERAGPERRIDRTGDWGGEGGGDSGEVSGRVDEGRTCRIRDATCNNSQSTLDTISFCSSRFPFRTPQGLVGRGSRRYLQILALGPRRCASSPSRSRQYRPCSQASLSLSKFDRDMYDWALRTRWDWWT